MEDRRTVALSAATDKKLRELVESTSWFGNDLDAYRLAVAVALARNLSTDLEPQGELTTKYNIGSLDPDQSLKCLVETFAPGVADRPYAYVQRLAEAGIQYLYVNIVEDNKLLSDVLSSDV